MTSIGTAGSHGSALITAARIRLFRFLRALLDDVPKMLRFVVECKWDEKMLHVFGCDDKKWSRMNPQEHGALFKNGSDLKKDHLEKNVWEFAQNAIKETKKKMAKKGTKGGGVEEETKETDAVPSTIHFQGDLTSRLDNTSCTLLIAGEKFSVIPGSVQAPICPGLGKCRFAAKTTSG
jgi:hypothetical protein